MSGSGGLPPSDPAWSPFYKLCIEANVPALIFVGTTGLGSVCRAAMASSSTIVTGILISSQRTIRK